MHSENSSSLRAAEKLYLAWIGLASTLVGGGVAYFSNRSLTERFQIGFGVPLQFVVTTFIGSLLILVGLHLHRKPLHYTSALSSMSRVMGFYPLLCALLAWRWGPAAQIFLIGALVIVEMRREHRFPLRNLILFYGMAYGMFAILQLKAIYNSPQSTPLLGL